MKLLSGALILSAIILSGADASAIGGECSLGSAAKQICTSVKMQVRRAKAEQVQQVAVMRGSQENAGRIAGAGKGLRTQEFPIAAEFAKLPAHALKASLAEGALQNASSSWRRNDWGICRAWVTCSDGTKISCWAEGLNCDASTGGRSVYCAAWDNYGYQSTSKNHCR